MKSEINQEFIEAFVMQYHGIECCKISDFPQLLTPYDALIYIKEEGYDTFEYIELRSIESLTDEEYEEIATHESVDSCDVGYLKNFKGCLYSETVDYLREKGVAIDFRETSEEEMIDSGKLKLKYK